MSMTPKIEIYDSRLGHVLPFPSALGMPAFSSSEYDTIVVSLTCRSGWRVDNSVLWRVQAATVQSVLSNESALSYLYAEEAELTRVLERMSVTNRLGGTLAFFEPTIENVGFILDGLRAYGAYGEWCFGALRRNATIQPTEHGKDVDIGYLLSRFEVMEAVWSFSPDAGEMMVIARVSSGVDACLFRVLAETLFPGVQR